MALRSIFTAAAGGRGVFGAELRPPQAAVEFFGAELRTRFVSFTGINNPICTCTVSLTLSAVEIHSNVTAIFTPLS